MGGIPSRTFEQAHVNETFSIPEDQNDSLASTETLGGPLMNNYFESITGYDPDDDEENVPLGWERSPITLPAPRAEWRCQQWKINIQMWSSLLFRQNLASLMRLTQVVMLILIP